MHMSSNTYLVIAPSLVYDQHYDQYYKVLIWYQKKTNKQNKEGHPSKCPVIFHKINQNPINQKILVPLYPITHKTKQNPIFQFSKFSIIKQKQNYLSSISILIFIHHKKNKIIFSKSNSYLKIK